MTIFMDTGGGDIYGGSTREEVLAAMKQHSDDIDDAQVFEVPGTMKIRNDDETGLVTLEEEFTDGIGAYCVASDNC